MYEWGNAHWHLRAIIFPASAGSPAASQNRSVASRTLRRREELPDLRSSLLSAAIVAGALLVAFGAHKIVAIMGKRASSRKSSPLFQLWVKFGLDSTRIILPLIALLLALPWLRIDRAILSPVTHAVGLALIGAIGWRMVRMVHTIESYIALRHPPAHDNVVSRRLSTQVQVLRHIATVVIVILTISIMLMTFPNIRHLGESLFASAGLAAIVGGLAARSTLSNLLAGIQIALTQPIRLEDVVIVEGEWGWIEEITSTYVVVRVWDLRRLVLPLSYFIEKPFQNWTRESTDLLGTVFLYADYTVPVNEVRQQLRRILESSGMWNGKAWGLQVTNLTDRTVELRALMSAPESSTAWDLRCYVREKLVEFLQERYPQCLPRARAEVEGRTDGVSAVA
jgi:small-conductance mechanosensitive channel